MAADEVKRSFKQYEYCSFCRFNHRKGKKHLYSAKHQEIINNILDKFRKKILKATNTLTDPEIESLSFENGTKFWCYFCSEEIVKHSVLDVCTLRYGGLLEHLTLPCHEVMTSKFFRENRVDETKRDSKVYCLSADKFQSFQKAAAVNVRKYIERKNVQKLKIASQLKEKEMRSRIISQWEARKQTDTQQVSRVGGTTHITGASWVPMSSGGVSTLTAHGEGLTFIGAQEFSVDDGNVHTGGVPPWLRTDQSDTSRAQKEIGPTMSDYEKHLEREKKKKLPPGRVGAKFDRSQITDVNGQGSQWLPSFGRVWNKGRRQQSKLYFQHELRKSAMSSPRARNVVLPVTHSSHMTAPPSEIDNVMPAPSRLEDVIVVPSKGQITIPHEVYSDTDTNHGKQTLKNIQQDIQPYRKKRKYNHQSSPGLYTHGALDRSTNNASHYCSKSIEEPNIALFENNDSGDKGQIFVTEPAEQWVNSIHNRSSGFWSQNKNSWDTKSLKETVNFHHDQSDKTQIQEGISLHRGTSQKSEEKKRPASLVSLDSIPLLKTPVLNKSGYKTYTRVSFLY